MNQKDEQSIEDRVNQTLNAFEKEVPPPLDPWFFDRLTNRITHELLTDRRAPEFKVIDILKPGFLATMLALNIVLMVWVFQADDSAVLERSNYIENLSSQYGFNYTDTYLLDESGE